jgi:hypothetical protein
MRNDEPEWAPLMLTTVQPGRDERARPADPLYLLGARMVENHPMVPLTDYLGLGIALCSYAGGRSAGGSTPAGIPSRTSTNS